MQIGWYDLNSDRSYPFLPGTVGQIGTGNVTALPEEAIVDCGLMLGPMTGFLPAEHSIWLQSVIHEPDRLMFVFDSDCPSLESREIQFLVPLPVTDRYQIIWSDMELVFEETSLSAGDCVETLEWTGFLVVGDLQSLLEQLPEHSAWNGPSQTVKLEPSCVQSLFGKYVTQVHVANQDRIRLTGWDGCRPNCHVYTTVPVPVARTCLTGEIYFDDGANATISVREAQNTLIFRAEPHAGLGMPCHPFLIYPAELSEILYAEQFPPCYDILKRINDLPGPWIRIKGGPGVSVYDFPSEHKIVIDVHGRGVLPEEELSVSLDAEDCPEPENPPDTNDPCQCGEEVPPSTPP